MALPLIDFIREILNNDQNSKFLSNYNPKSKSADKSDQNTLNINLAGLSPSILTP
jgi:hypothetical protein